MRFGWLERVLSLGEAEAVTYRAARHVRVTNAMALIGTVLNLCGVPVDLIASPPSVTAFGFGAAAGFASCWWFNARGQLTMARVMLMFAADTFILLSVWELGGPPELRTMFFPLAVLPFLIFGVEEKASLAVFILIPVVAYFALGLVPVQPRNVAAVGIYHVYAPVLAFLLLVAGVYVFARIDDRTQDKLVDLRQRAARSARLVALGEMSSGIAHEVRNPLAAIHIAASQIAEMPDDPAQVALLGQRIQRIVMRASRIIESMRVVARDGGGDAFACAPLRRVVDDALDVCGERLKENAIEVRGAEGLPATDGLEVECRSVQITQVLVNLLGNAFDAIAEQTERWVSIEVAATGNGVEIAVSNSGEPIPVSVRPRLFEPFFTTKSPDRGTGIGLSLSRELVEAHHGTLTLDERSPHTRFVVSLPLRQPAAVP